MLCDEGEGGKPRLLLLGTELLGWEGVSSFTTRRACERMAEAFWEVPGMLRLITEL